MGFVKGFSGKGSVADIEKYLKNPEKTNFNLISGHNVSPDSIKDSFDITKNLYRKTGGVQYHHVVQSFHVEERISPEKVHQLGREFAEKNFKGFEVLIVTHTNERHLHNHFLINSVSLETGKKYHSNVTKMNKLKEFSNEQCSREGLEKSICKHGEKQLERQSAGEFRLLERGKYSWKDEIRQKAIQCRGRSLDFADFQKNMKELGVEVFVKGKTVTYHLGENKCRARRLGANYEKANLEVMISKNLTRQWTRLKKVIPEIKHIERVDNTGKIKEKINEMYINHIKEKGRLPEKEETLILVKQDREIDYAIRECKLIEIKKDILNKGNNLLQGMENGIKKHDYEQNIVNDKIKRKAGENDLKKKKQKDTGMEFGD